MTGNWTHINCLKKQLCSPLHHHHHAFFAASKKGKEVSLIKVNWRSGEEEKSSAIAGNRTRIKWLGSNNAYHYTTIDMSSLVHQKRKKMSLMKVIWKKGQRENKKKLAMAGNPTRICWLEGNYADHDSTITMNPSLLQKRKEISLIKVNWWTGQKNRVLQWLGIEPESTAWKATTFTTTPPSQHPAQCLRMERSYL